MIRRRSSPQNENKVKEGKTIKDPAFKALYQNALNLESFLQELCKQAKFMVEALRPFCLTGMKWSQYVLEYCEKDIAFLPAAEKEIATFRVDEAKRYHAATTLSFGSIQDGIFGGFQKFIEDLDNFVLLPLSLQLQGIQELKAKMVLRDQHETQMQASKTKLENHLGLKKSPKQSKKLNESTWNDRLVALQDDQRHSSEKFNRTHQQLFDELNDLLNHKTDVVYASCEALKRAQLTFFSMTSAQLRGCVKTAKVADDTTVAMSIDEVGNALKDSFPPEKKKRSSFKDRLFSQRKRNSSSPDKGMEGEAGNDAGGRAIGVNEAILPYSADPSDKVTNTIGVDKDHEDAASDPAVETPMAFAWTTRRQTESSYEPDGEELGFAGATKIKEILSVTRQKYTAGMISKEDKTSIKNMLKEGRVDAASDRLGIAISNGATSSLL